MAKVSVYYQGVEVLQYDRELPLPILQQHYVTRMDRRMDGGVDLDGRHVAVPDAMERAQFVAGAMAQALSSGDETKAAAMFTYLVQRLPLLRAVRIDRQNQRLTTELVIGDANTVPDSSPGRSGR